jgi:peptide/nickel transport system substrate-binding protein
MRAAWLLLAWAAWLQAAGANELRFAIAGDPKTFDALHVSEENSEVVRYLTGGVLVRVNRATDQVQPELAESWEIMEGGRAISFHLRAGLRFSDGSALMADDVARTLRTALDPKQASPAGDAFRSDKGNPEIKVTGPRDVTLRYPGPRPGLDRLFDSLSIVPARTAGRFPASAGPFFVAEYKSGEFVRLTRNPRYWKKDAAGRQLPYLDSMRIEFQPNRDLEVARFLRGELDLINKLEPLGFDRVAKANPAAARNAGASLDSEFVWFNQRPSPGLPEWKRKWFTSAAFRHALSQSIRRDDIARVVFGGHAHAAAGPVSPANRFWFDAALKPLPYDGQTPLQALAAEGFTLRDGVLRDGERHPVEFSLITNAGNRPRQAMAAVVQEDLGKIGIRVNIVTLDFSSLIERIMKSFQYEAALLGFANVELDPNEQMNVWLSSGQQHAWWPGEKTPATPWEAEIDRLELAQASEASRDARKKAFDAVQKIAVKQEPIIYLVNPDYLGAIAPRVKGAQPGAIPPQILWNVEWLQVQ